MDYTLAMDDQMLKVFHDFKRGALGEASTATIQNLLRLYHPPHITSAAQLKRVGIEDPSVLQQLANMGFTNQAPEELVGKTRYKILLSAEQSDYPNVRVQGDHVSSQFVMSFKAGENRAKAHDWLSALLDHASSVTIVDRYLCHEQTGALKPNGKKFFELLPRRQLSVFVSRAQQKTISDIKKTCHDWTVKKDTTTAYKNVHDRYLRIDGKMEVVITSGIDYLFDTDKECTLLVRKIIH